MKSNWEVVNEFSRKTGISDPNLDLYLKHQEECPYMKGRTGWTDYWYDDDDVWYGIDYGSGRSTSTYASEPAKTETLTLDDLQTHLDRMLADGRPEPTGYLAEFCDFKWINRFMPEDNILVDKNSRSTDIYHGCGHW